MIPPVTMLAVPIVRRTNPQKMPACIRPARTSLNILVWMTAYSISPTSRAPIWPNGRGCSTAGRAAAKTRRWRAIASSEDDRGSPEQDEDERVARDVREHREHHSCSSGEATSRGRRGRGAGRRHVVERPGQRLEGVVEDRDDGLERLDRTLRAARQVDDEGPAADADDRPAQIRHRRVAAALRPHRLGEPRHLVVDDGQGGLRRHIPRRQPGSAGRDDERVPLGLRTQDAIRSSPGHPPPRRA